MGIGTTSPAPEAILDLYSTTSGLLIPRMTTMQRLNLANGLGTNVTSNGMMVYDVSLQKLMIYDSTFNGFAGTWQVYQTTDKTWNTVGNQGTNYTSEFIGTTDDVALSFRVNNLQSGLIDQHTKTTKLGYATGFFGIGKSTSTQVASETACQSVMANVNRFSLSHNHNKRPLNTWFLVHSHDVNLSELQTVNDVCLWITTDLGTPNIQIMDMMDTEIRGVEVSVLVKYD